MIGQTQLISDIDSLVGADKFPRFSIIVGDLGSGRRTLATYIANKLDALCTIIDTKAQDIREMIDNAYTATDRIVYVIACGDNMSITAKNAILKVTEEPPHNAYFILTLEILDNALPTIVSRGTVFRMLPYSKFDLTRYYNSKGLYDNIDIVLRLCNNLGEVDRLLDTDIVEFYNFVERVVDNIAVVSSSNSFKICNRIAFNDEQDKYDIRLFFKAFIAICLSRVRDSVRDYASGILITSTALRALRVSGANEGHIFDMWILDIRKSWFQ